MHLSRSSSNVPRLPSFWKRLQNPHALLTFDKVRNPPRLPRKTTSERPKVFHTLQFLRFWLNVLRATTACVFSTSQLPLSALNVVCFVHFDLGMCFAPQWHALFQHLNFQKCSEPAALASLLFDPPEPQIIGQTQCFATFLPFRAPGSSFFWDFLFLVFFLLIFSSLTLPISAFHLSILSEVWLLNFLDQGNVHRWEGYLQLVSGCGASQPLFNMDPKSQVKTLAWLWRSHCMWITHIPIIISLSIENMTWHYNHYRTIYVSAWSMLLRTTPRATSKTNQTSIFTTAFSSFAAVIRR